MLAFNLTACEEEIAIVHVNVAKDVVVNSAFAPNKEFSVNLTYTRNILNTDEQIDYIEDAQIIVTDEMDNYLFEMEYDNDGNYLKRNLYPLENKVYRIEVHVEGYSPIRAESKIPSKATVTNLSKESVEVDGKTVLKIDFDIENSNEDNYYIWEIVTSEEEIDPTMSDPNVFQSQNYQYVYNNGSVQNEYWSKLFLNNTSTIGATISNSFYTLPSGSDGPSPEEPNDPTTIQKSYLKLISASADLYNYYLSVEQSIRQGDSVNSSSAIPVKIHSNIKGGLGIFAGYNEQYIEL